MKTKTDFSKLLVGTKIWSSNYGYGKIIKIGPPDCTYPITVDFGGACVSVFTEHGKFSTRDSYPSLFLKPLPGFEDGTAFESEIPDERIGKKCIFWDDVQSVLTISSLQEIQDDKYYKYRATNGCEYVNCELYTPEKIVELTERL